jgi:hypothetical protein
MLQPDYISEAIRHSREDFVRHHGCFFLVGPSTLTTPSRASLNLIAPYEEDDVTCTSRLNPLLQSRPGLIFAVRKVQEAFPSMITIGRTPNNDVVLSDVQISRFHAYFKVGPGQVELGDAGSANGTFVDGKRLAPKGAMVTVTCGARLRFADHDFVFIDAAGTWTRLRASHP